MAIAQNQDDEVMAAINVTPLTDVLLVLLIIFMITANALQKERIKLPITHYKNKANETDTIITIEKNGDVFVGANRVALEHLEAYLEKLRNSMPEDEEGHRPNKIIIKADQSVEYGTVAEAMDASKTAGFNEISLATKPLEEAKQEENP
jgi:biopolymer transport protein TolR